MFLVRFSIQNPLITNLFLVLVVMAGVLSWYAMPQEMFPVIELDKITVKTIFEGATPEEVERQVTLPIEEELDGLPDIKVMTSASSEGMSSIVIEFKPGTDVDDFLREAQALLDRLTELPEQAEAPEISRLQTRFPVISLALFGDVAKPQLYDVAEQVKRKLLAIPGVAGAGMSGKREWELWVIVDPARLSARHVSLVQVNNALRAGLIDLPGGSIKALEGDIMLRGVGASSDPQAIEQLVVHTNAQGGELLLREIATVQRRLEEPQTLGRFNGQPSVNITVTKTPEASTIEVSEQVRHLVETLQQELPASIHADAFSDLSVYVKTRLETVKSSGLVGLTLVLLSLYLFLNFRVALITALGIPVSFLFATILLSYMGYSVNMVSLFAFLIVLGMIVDDAIIVTENIYRHMENGLPAQAAALHGAREVFWPVVASTATTIAAFLPMLAVGGTMGAFIAVIPVVAICALSGSLLEAFAVLPSHAAELLHVQRQRRTGRVNWRRWLQYYTDIVRWSLHNRYFVAALIASVLILTLAFAATRIPFQMFGNVDTGQFFVNAEAPNTYSLQDTEKLAQVMEHAVMGVVRENELKSLLTNVGVTFLDFNTIKFDSSYIQLVLDLKKRVPQGFIERWITPLVSMRFDQFGTRERSSTEVINAVREKLQAISGVQRLAIMRPQGGPAGADIEVGIGGANMVGLQHYGKMVADYLQRLPGVRDVRQDMEPGKLEYRYTLNDRGRKLGLTQAQLAEAVRSGFQGEEVAQVTWRDKRIPVRVIYPESLRSHSDSLARLPVTLSTGRTVYLGDVANIETGRGFNVIKRRSLQRLVTVTAEVDAAITTPLQVTELVKNEFSGLPDQGYQLVFMGEKKEAGESLADMRRALFIALLLIFLILAALFNSLLDPLVVMFAIPFGAIGVVIGHYLLGYNLQFLSMIGFLALSGIVVNDSLILVEFAKRMREQGHGRIEAMVEAGRVRARPILLTSITTFLGVSPLIFFSTGQTAFLAPMAVSLGFGLLFATLLVLVGIPCFYMIADDGRHKAASIWHYITRMVMTREGGQCDG